MVKGKLRFIVHEINHQIIDLGSYEGHGHTNDASWSTHRNAINNGAAATLHSLLGKSAHIEVTFWSNRAWIELTFNLIKQ